MYIFGYLRASAHDQDASRAQQRLKAFALEHNHRVAGWYVEKALLQIVGGDKLIIPFC